MKSSLPSCAAVLLLAISGCNLPQPQADSVRHFTLSASSDAKPAADATSVRPVRLAGHLRSRAMAVRLSDNEITYLEDVRWAEPLDEGITQLLRQRLRPIGGGALVTVHVQRCEVVRSESNAVVFHATYTITMPDGRARQGVFASGSRRWDGKDYAALVGQLREAVGEFGEVLAAEITPPSKS